MLDPLHLFTLENQNNITLPEKSLGFRRLQPLLAFALYVVASISASRGEQASLQGSLSKRYVAITEDTNTGTEAIIRRLAAAL